MSTLPTVILPGYLARAREYEPLQQELMARGIPARIVPLEVSSWFPTIGGRPVTPILQALETTLQRTLQEFSSYRVNLIGHSAGGWIARIYLGKHPYHGRIWSGQDKVSTLVTLGTPHLSRERWTRANLNFVNQTYPGAYWPQVKMVCVAGRAVQGRPLSWGALSLSDWIAFNSYQMTAGQGGAWGDGITPIEAAHLEGAINLTLEGVVHAPKDTRPWYGSPQVIPEWIDYLR